MNRRTALIGTAAVAGGVLLAGGGTPREGVKPQIVAKRTLRDAASNRGPGLDAIRALLS
jgi:hypothetical protein